MPVDNEIAIKSTALSGEFKKPVIKYPRCIPNQDFQKVLKRINSLCENPGAGGCVKLACQEGYKVSQGVHRIIYEIKSTEPIILVVKVARGGQVNE